MTAFVPARPSASEMAELITLVSDGLEDEGDRVYLGSTNHKDLLRDMTQAIFEARFDDKARATVSDMRRKRDEEQHAEIERLREALRPFADAAPNVSRDDTFSGWRFGDVLVTPADFRRASVALEPQAMSAPKADAMLAERSKP